MQNNHYLEVKKMARSTKLTKLNQPVVDFNALTPKHIIENTEHFYDSYGRLSMTVFGVPIYRIDIDSMKGDDHSTIELIYRTCSLQVLNHITILFGMTPKTEGYEKCNDHTLRFVRNYENDFSNQHIRVSVAVSRYDIPEEQKETFAKLLETIYSNEVEGA